MEQDKDIIERIKQLPDKAPIYPGLAQEAMVLTEKKYRRRRAVFTNKMRRYIAIGAASLVLIALVVVPIAIFNSSSESPSDHYIIGDELTAEEIDCVEDAIYYSNGKAGKYFSPSIAQTVLMGYYFISNHELAYLLQQAVIISEDSFDIVKLSVVFIDKKYSDLQPFELCDKAMSVGDITASYYIIEKTTSSEIYCSFVKDDVRYNMQITSNNTEGKIENYISLLFS